jgi:hypothetical protein
MQVDDITNGYQKLQKEITKYQKLIPEITLVEGDEDIDFAVKRAEIEAKIAENKKKIIAMQTDEIKGNIQRIAALQEENNLLKQQYDLMNPKDETNNSQEIKDKVKQIKDYAKEQQAAIEEEIKQTQVLADTQKRIYENEENETNTRISALQSYYTYRQEIIDLGAKKEKSANEVSNQQILYIEADRLRASTALEQAKQDEVLNIIKQSQAQQYKQAQKIGEDMYQLRQVELGDLLRDFKKQVEENMGNKAALLSLEEQYQQKRTAVIDKYNNMALDAEIEYLTNLLAATENNLQLQEQIYARIAELRRQYSENAFSSDEGSTVNTVKQATGKGRKSNKTKDFNDVIFGLDPNTTSEAGESEYRAVKANADKQIGIYMDIWSSATDIMNDYYDQQIQRIDEAEKKEREAYEKSLKNIDEKFEKGLLSEEEADAQRRIIEETWLQKEKEYDAQRREMQLKQARWEKAEAIVQAGIKTAQAVVSALGVFPPPLGMALAAIVGAMGAAQVAVIASKKIPQYAEGTDFHKGGLAIVGDAGKSEAVIMPSGNVWKTPDTATIVNLPRGTEVLPDYRQALINSITLTANPFLSPENSTTNSTYDDILRSNTRTMTKQLDAINTGIKKIRKNAMYTENLAKIELIRNRWK